jgi:hypothetical protein
MERLDVTDAQYWAGAAFPAAAPALTVEIVNISLAYETAILNPDEVERINKKEKLYYRDLVLYRDNKLRSNCMYETVTVLLPQGCLFAIQVFVSDVQTISDAQTYSYLSPRYRYPANLSWVQTSLVGKDGLTFRDGLHHLGQTSAASSHSLRAFHKDLVQKKLTDKTDFNDWLPSNGIGYWNTLMHDFMDYRKHFTAEVDFKVSLKWSAASPERWSLLTFCLTQEEVSHHPKNRWTWKLLNG